MAQHSNTATEIEFSVSIYKTLLSIGVSFIGHLPFIIAATGMLFLTWLLAYLFQRYSHRLLDHWRKRQSLRDLIARLVIISIWTGGILIAAMILFPGLTPTRALGAMGLVSIAIGFAFRDIFENFFAGILILWRYPFETGDFIECEEFVGQVEDINIRMSMIRQTSGELVVVPNAFLFKNPVAVLTDRPRRRVTIITGIAYSENVTKAVAVIDEAVKSCQSVHQQQPVQVFPSAFGSSSIDIEVSWWTDPEPVAIRRSRGEVITAIKQALDEAGIEIPFPYRTLTFKDPLAIDTGLAQESKDL